MFKNLKSKFLIFALGLFICFNTITPASAMTLDELNQNLIGKHKKCIKHSQFPHKEVLNKTFRLGDTSFEKRIIVTNVHVHKKSYPIIECHPHINIHVRPADATSDDKDEMNFHIWAEKSKKGKGCIVVWESRSGYYDKVCDNTQDIYATAKERVKNICKEIADKLDDVKWGAIYALIGTVVIEVIKNLWWVIVL